MRLLDAAGIDNAIAAFMNLDMGRAEIQEMLALTPAERLERGTTDARAAAVLRRTIERIRRANEEMSPTGR